VRDAMQRSLCQTRISCFHAWEVAISGHVSTEHGLRAALDFPAAGGGTAMALLNRLRPEKQSRGNV
jgi:hypothetical protein